MNKILNRFGLGFGLLALVIAGPLFLFLVTGTSLPLYLSWVVALSGATFVTFMVDKVNASRRGSFRAPEMLLHLLTLLGGFPGAWAGMVFGRHKTKHPVFWGVLGVSTVLHVGLIIWIYLL